MRPTRLILAAVPALLGLAAAQAHAQLVVTPTFDSTWSLDPTAAADEATITSMLATTYDADFTNPVTVAIDFSDVNTGLGTSLTGYYGTSYSSYQSALTSVKQVANGGDGNTAFLAELPASGNPVPGNSTAGVSFTSAQGRALGLGTAGVVTVTGETGTFDSNIMLNMGLIQSDGYSLVGVAEHEIDEALGVGSALDGRADIAGTATVASVGAMDFFRYSAPGVRSFTSDSTAESYFSYNNGVTKIVYYNQQTGADYHDWASAGDGTDGAGVDGPPQVQDAFSTPNVPGNRMLGPSEFEALNDVGYNRAVAAPEPSQIAGLGLGALGVAGLAFKARRRSVKA
jgi:hypothetical protein